VEEQLKGLALDDAAPPPAAAAAAGPGGLGLGALAVARYALDGNWYRAYVEKVGGGVLQGACLGGGTHCSGHR
jgi:hypothetical protein